MTVKELISKCINNRFVIMVYPGDALYTDLDQLWYIDPALDWYHNNEVGLHRINYPHELRSKIQCMKVSHFYWCHDGLAIVIEEDAK